GGGRLLITRRAAAAPKQPNKQRGTFKREAPAAEKFPLAGHGLRPPAGVVRFCEGAKVFERKAMTPRSWRRRAAVGAELSGTQSVVPDTLTVRWATFVVWIMGSIGFGSRNQ